MFEVPCLGHSARILVMTCSVTFGHFLFTLILFIPSIGCVGGCLCVCECMCVVLYVCVCACARVCMIICVRVYVFVCMSAHFCVCVYADLCRLLYDCMFLWETFSTEALAKHKMFKISLFIRTKHTFYVFGSCFRMLALILIQEKNRGCGGKGSNS